MIQKIRSLLNRWSAYKAKLRSERLYAYIGVEAIETIVVALFFALLIRRFLVQTSLVYSGSMIPTMQIGDRLFVDKLVYQYRDPHRGDIILFNSPYRDGKEYVKRLVGLPGETVEIRKGIVFVNGKEMAFPGINIQRDYSFFGPEVVPSGSYFALGDNRGNSSDSRVWGYVHRSDLLGRAVFVFWPIQRMQLLN